MSEHALTMRDVPVLDLDGRRFPLFFSVTCQEQWAERLEMPLDVLLQTGLPAKYLVGADLRALMHLALAGGEARRFALEGNQALPVEESHVGRLLSLYSWAEVVGALVEAWNWPPAPMDPQAPAPAAETATADPSPSPSSSD